MKRLMTGTIGAALVLASVFGATAAASATVAYPEGGTWDYGVRWVGGSNDQAYSDYHHNKREHKSTACSTAGCVPSAWMPPNRWSLSTRPASLWGNSFYYDVR